MSWFLLKLLKIYIRTLEFKLLDRFRGILSLGLCYSKGMSLPRNIMIIHWSVNIRDTVNAI